PDGAGTKSSGRKSNGWLATRRRASGIQPIPSPQSTSARASCPSMRRDSPRKTSVVASGVLEERQRRSRSNFSIRYLQSAWAPDSLGGWNGGHILRAGTGRPVGIEEPVERAAITSSLKAPRFCGRPAPAFAPRANSSGPEAAGADYLHPGVAQKQHGR